MHGKTVECILTMSHFEVKVEGKSVSRQNLKGLRGPLRLGLNGFSGTRFAGSSGE